MALWFDRNVGAQDFCQRVKETLLDPEPPPNSRADGRGAYRAWGPGGRLPGYVEQQAPLEASAA